MFPPLTPRAREPLIVPDGEACRECWRCVRYCPAKAIRIVEGRGEVVAERCVSCGACVAECRHLGHSVRDDTPRVWALLDSGRPVVALLASEFVAALHPLTPSEIERDIEGLGFYAVESTVLGEEMVAAAYAESLKRECAFPVLRSTCPVVNDWVRRFHPALSQALAPIVPPYIAQARLVKKLYPADTAVVYVSPCYARKDEIEDPELAGAVDVAIDFFELQRMLASGRRKKGCEPKEECGESRPTPVRELSLNDGFPRALLADRSMLSTEVLVTRGLHELEDVLRGMERGEIGPVIVDMLNCEGCIDGPTVNPSLSVFAKRNIEASERRARGRSAVSTRTLLRHLPSVDLVRAFTPEPVTTPQPTDAEIAAILAEAGFSLPDGTIDCGACGYRTCAEHAAAIHRASSTWEACFPLQRGLLSERVGRLEETTTLDELTGLWNRRMFAERLVDEVARHDRYGTPVSLVLVGVDRLSAVNDVHGREAGDRLLACLAAELRRILRVTDLIARFGDDEFAIILPGLRKTAAFAVAEKVRTAASALLPAVTGDGYTTVVPLTVSIGVAGVSPALDGPADLIDAAEAALTEAKESGRDQVRLAPDEG